MGDISKRIRRRAGSPTGVILLLLGVLIISLIIPSVAQQSDAPKAKLEPFTQTIPEALVKIEMIPIPGGTVKIGDQTVTVKPFYIAKTETTWEAFDAFTNSGPASPAYDQTDFKADAIARPSKSYILPDLGWGHNGYPAINVSFLSSDMFCRWLSATSKKKFRLPTEAEWELACRAGEMGAWKMNEDQLEKHAWYAENSDEKTHPVGKKLPNKFGLHDILGNVGEWAVDAKGKPVLCGGTFLDEAEDVTPGKRRRQTPEWQETDPQFPKSRWWLSDGKFVGFRIVCEP